MIDQTKSRARRVKGIALGAALLGATWMASRRRRELELRDRTVLITGGSRGLGYILARDFARKGARVVICARSADGLQRASEEFARQGLDVLTFVCDVTDRQAVDEMVGKVVAHQGSIDVVVNNASIIQVAPAELMTEQDYRMAHEVNFWGTVHVTLACLPWLKGQSGARIVNIASIGGEIAVPHLLPYVTAKFAVVGFSLGLRAELAELGIRVCTIVPGLMRTGSFGHALFKGERDREYAWFKLSSTLPLISMDAERASRRILLACQRGEAHVVLGAPFKFARAVTGIAPGWVANTLGWVNRLLPQPANEQQADLNPDEGRFHEAAVSQSSLTRLGDKAAHRFNETG